MFPSQSKLKFSLTAESYLQVAMTEYMPPPLATAKAPQSPWQQCREQAHLQEG